MICLQCCLSHLVFNLLLVNTVVVIVSPRLKILLLFSSLPHRIKTNVNANGEAGKIAANDYVRGDSAFMFLYTLQGDEKVDVSAKPLFQKILLKSISQKGDNSEGFRVNKIEAGSPGLNGQTYVVVDFEYKINTEAGFLVSRKGVAAFTSVGPDVQTLVSVTTDKRYKELGEALHDIARSFRVNKLNSGVFAS